MRCYCASTRLAARRLTRLYEAELRAAKMNPAQFELLATLKGRPGSSQSELGAALDLDQTTLSRNLKLLIARGWVTAAASAQDRRRVEYGLSGEGGAALAAAMPCWERATARVREGMGAEAEGVWGMLERLGTAGDSDRLQV